MGYGAMSLSQEMTSLSDPALSPSVVEANGFPHPAPFPAASVNGHSSRALPSHTRRRRTWVFYFGIAVAVLLVGGAAAAYYAFRPASARPDVLLHTVKREKLDVTVTEKGTLESANNIDVVCKVRAGNKGFATSINWVIDDGSKVKKDQLLMILDDSALQDNSRDEKIKVDQAYAAKVQAEKQYDIIVKGNEVAIANKENVLNGAQIDLEKLIGLSYDPAEAPTAAVVGVPAALTEGGDYKRQLDDLTGKVRLADSDVEQYREIAAWADRMVKMKYMSAAQAQAQRSKLESTLEDLRSKQSQRSLFVA